MTNPNDPDEEEAYTKEDLQQIVESLREHVGDSLESLSPEEGKERYLGSIKSNITQSTFDEYDTELGYFVEYCDTESIDNLNDLTGRDLADYKEWRRHSSSEVDELATKTMRDEMFLLRSSMYYLEKIEGVEIGIAEKVEIPELESGEGVRDVELDMETLEQVLDYLAKFEYASREHVVISIIAETARRLGGVHSLDLEDAHLDIEHPYLEFKHHDDGRTRLKNGEDGEAEVNISEELAELISHYIETNRYEKEVDGRKPLLTTQYGRLSKSTIRSYFYRWTRPCMIGKDCPMDRDEEDCEAARGKDAAPKCPVSEAPHAARHGGLTEMRRNGLPKEIVSERCDVSEEILDKHYDERSAEEKRELRRKMLEEMDDGEDDE